MPLIERLKFLAIFASNLDEFFMVRVAGVHSQIEARIDARGPDGLSPTQLMDEISRKVRAHDARQANEFAEVVRPELASHGIRIVSVEDSGAPAAKIERHFREHIFPALTPLAIGPGRPFPYISNLSLSLLVRLHDPMLDHEVYARVKVPEGGPAALCPDRQGHLRPARGRHRPPPRRAVPGDGDHLPQPLPGHAGRGLRDLRRSRRPARRRSRTSSVDAVSARWSELEVGAGIEPHMRERLIDWLGIMPTVRSTTRRTCLTSPISGRSSGSTATPTCARSPGRRSPIRRCCPGRRRRRSGQTCLRRCAQEDLLVHYPYQSFSTSVERFVLQAVDDPKVLAIKMTVYRTSDDSALVPALIDAAEKGKQAVCMVELKARFDERRNIRWSRALEEVGAHVVHGIPGLKTHAKAILVVRARDGEVRHYVMIGTGNFHAKTARLYEDFGLFTTDHELGQEVANLFNTLTGYGHPRASARCWSRPIRCGSR